MKKNKYIQIEEMLFNDYRVNVWEGINPLLDREYFCRGYFSAAMTAREIRTLPGFEGLDIYLMDHTGNNEVLDYGKE